MVFKLNFKSIYFVFIPAVCTFFWASSVTAATLQVPSTSYPNIQAGIEAAGTGDTVAVAAGTYSGTGNWDLDFNGKAITVQCTATEPETCTIDGLGTWHRGFDFHSGEGADSVLDGFTITRGKANQGGAISCVSASPTITNCKFIDNESVISDGGAIYCSNASPNISNCDFSNNNSPYDGGAIYCTGSAPNITGCTFNANEAAIYGGGIFFEASSDATITGCSFTNNLAQHGAGIACKSSSPIISNSTFETNTASNRGGGIYCTAASPEVSECTLTGNIATRHGGGIYCDDASAPTIFNCEINTNASPGISGVIYGQGGGIYSTDSTPNVSGCDLIGNTALSGAGIYSSNSPMTIENCNITSNVASLSSGGNGGGVYISGGVSTTEIMTISYSTIDNNSAYDGAGIYCTDSDPAVFITTISGNTAERNGGGILCYESIASIFKCLIKENDALYGGGIRISGEPPVNGNTVVANSIIIDNTADYGAGIYILSGSPGFANNTITKNTANAASGGGGLYYYSSTRRPEFYNTIFWGNTPNEIVDNGPILVEYCNVQGGYAGPGGTGNIDSDPLFEDAVNNDFHLTSGSPCIDAATDFNAPPEDYDGNLRWDDPDTPNNTGDCNECYYDIGAYEYYPACECDFSTSDGDVDGADLAAYIVDPAGFSLDVFAADFGRTNCP